MLTEKDLRMFRTFRVGAMGDKVREMIEDERYDALTFEEKIKLMLDAEAEARSSRKLNKLVKDAGFADPGACVEEVIYLADRSLNKDRIQRIALCDWYYAHQNVVVVSAAGGGKSYLAQALGNAACRLGIGVLYTRLMDMVRDLAAARELGAVELNERIEHYRGVPLLIIDDYMVNRLPADNATDLVEVMAGRVGRASTIVASQAEPNEWYLQVKSKNSADTISNRTSSGALHIVIKGPDMRKYLASQKTAL